MFRTDGSTSYVPVVSWDLRRISALSEQYAGLHCGRFGHLGEQVAKARLDLSAAMSVPTLGRRIGVYSREGRISDRGELIDREGLRHSSVQSHPEHPLEGA